MQRQRRTFQPCLLPAVVALAAVVSLATPAAVAASRSDSLAILQEQYREASAQFSADMRALADFCRQHGYEEDAERIRQRAVPFAEQTLDVDDLPRHKQPDLPQGIPPVELEWRSKLKKYQTEYADKLYLLARRALADGHSSFAFRLIREVAFQHPDHRMARKALGYLPGEDGWATPYENTMQRRGHVWDDRFGWLPRAHLARYQNGERFYGNGWISAEKEAAIRSDFRKAWVVRTEHYEIHTNHSLERGVELSVALEDFHRFFVREFAGFFNSPEQIKALLDPGSGNSRHTDKRHVIHYYRTRGEFITSLKPKQANVELCNGLYLPNDRTAYFYHDPENVEANMDTLFHEVTHQLFGESTRSVNLVGQDAHFWIIEGIACYLESFEREDGRLEAGDPGHIRMYWARRRVVEEDYLIPFDRFASLGMREFQAPGDLEALQRYYSQAAGMAHFYMHYDDGRYRDALILHLSQIYSPDRRVRGTAQGMDQLTGVPYKELERQYREHVAAFPE